MARVRIGGAGLVSSYGRGAPLAAQRMLAGRNGITPLTLFEPPFRDQVVVNQIDRAPFGEGQEAIEAMLEAAIDEALQQAGHGPGILAEDCALIIGSSSAMYISEAEYRRYYGTGEELLQRRQGSAADIAHALTRALDMRGPAFTVQTACSSSANAMILGHDLITRGQARRALVLGADGLSTIGLSGFYSLMLLDPAGCHPFDSRRNGLQVGEGFAALLLERGDGETRGPWLLGGDNLCDIHHVTSASPDGSGMRLVMERALAAAGVAPADIRLIKAHGTGSNDNDTAEAAAMRDLFGRDLPPFTVLKRYLGHTLGACGVVETAALLACLDAGRVPPALGFERPDPALGVTPLTEAWPAEPGHYLLNFFGFGGNYTSLVMTYD